MASELTHRGPAFPIALAPAVLGSCLTSGVDPGCVGAIARRPSRDPVIASHRLASRLRMTGPGACTGPASLGQGDGAADAASHPGRGLVAKLKQLPDLVGEFIALAKQYLRERTVDRAKALGKLAAFGFAGAAVCVLASLFLAVAGMRAIVDLLPDGNIWSGFGYVLAAFGLFIVSGLIAWRAVK
jgi:hypothetical protein